MTSNLARRGLCLVVAAPSGAGKSSLTRALLAAEPNLALSVSVTTRERRANEQEGVHYFFRSQEHFDSMARRGELLERATVFGRGYGTPRAPVEAALASGRDIVFDVDWQGHRQLCAALPADVVGVFVLPPSLAALEARLRGRNTDDETEIDLRMRQARDEMSHAPEFDHVLLNGDFTGAVDDLRAILRASRLVTGRQTGLASFLAALTP